MGRTLAAAKRVAAVFLVLATGLSQASAGLAEDVLAQLTDTTGFSYTQPSLSADGTRIAVWSPGQQAVYTVNLDGTGFKILAGPSADRSSGFSVTGPPSVSADGRWVAFAAQYLGTDAPTCPCGDIFLIPFEGGRAFQMTPQLVGDPDRDQPKIGSRGNPVISGDASLIVFGSNSNFTGQNGDQSEELFAVRTRDGALRQVTSFANVAAPNIGDIQVTLTAFAPSPDFKASRLAFYLTDQRLRRVDGGADPVSFDTSVYAVSTDGTGLRKLSSASDNLSLQEALGERPSISGDGSLVAFPAFLNLGGANPDGGVEVFTVKADGTGLRQLTSSSGRSAFPSLNYDGSRVAYTQYEPSVFERQRYEVYVSNADGTALTRLTSTPGDPISKRSGYEGVALSADASRVAFSSSGDLLGKNADGNTELFTRRLTSLLPLQGVRNRALPADLALNRSSLVAGRDLVVRAFLDTGTGGPAAPARGRLVVDEGTAQQAIFDVQGYTAQPSGYFADKPEARQRLDDSINFFITGKTADDLLTPGAHTFKATIAPQDAGAFTSWQETVQASFRQADTLDIFIIPVQVTDSSGALVAPDGALLQNAADFLRATYPVDENRTKVRNFVLAPINIAQAPGTKALRLSLAQQVQATLNAQLLAGNVPNPAKRNFAAGVVPNLVDGQDPLGSTATTQNLGYTFPAIRGTVVSLDREPAAAPAHPLIGSTIAHEIGHTLGLGDEYANGTLSLNNPPPSSPADGNANGNFVQEATGGLDTANRVAVFNRNGAEFLGYMGGGNDLNSWATDTEYSFIYPQVTTDTVKVNSASSTTRFINVSGIITKTGGIQLDPFVVATSPYTFTRPAGTQYTFQMKNPSGAVLDSVVFDVEFTEEIRGQGNFATDAAPFSFTIPLPAGVASMAVLTGTTPMISYTVSPRPPTVSVAAPNGGETLRGQSQITWLASDPDGDSLTYTVMYSPNGTDRFVLATNVATTTLGVNFGRLPTGNNASIIVRASDGFNFAEDASDAPFAAGQSQLFLPVLPHNLTGW